MDNSDFQEVERMARDELIASIARLKRKGTGAIYDVQPSDAVVYAMAQAAVQVLIAFERGWQVNADDDE